MSAPHDPEDDPTAAGADDEATNATDEDAAWRAIVANYGERHELGEAPEHPATGHHPSTSEFVHPATSDPEPHRDPEDRYVPPAPPPVPRPEPRRLLAWLGLFGVPTFVLVSLVLGVDLPAWSGLILMTWFVGGFVYLVASMRPGPSDDFDDGAVL